MNKTILIDGSIILDSSASLNLRTTTHLNDASAVILQYDDSQVLASIENGVYSVQSSEYEDRTTSDKIEFANLDDNNASYALLRTNPYLTGNIKLVVDNKNNIYIDTFPINNALSKRKYRKVPVNYRDYYGKNVMAVFREMSTDDIFYVKTDTKDLLTTTTNYASQYDDTYNCGVKINNDTLYPENFALLAPLCVKNTLPDYFLVFKLDDILKDEQDSAATLKTLLSKGKLIKTYDFTEGSKLGTYLRTFRNNAIKSKSYIYFNYNLRSNNVYSGISIDKGVLSNIYESAQLYKTNVSTLVGSDYYLSEGFKRNRIVAPDVLNFEFMFDDTDYDLFSINTYFGVYVKANDIVKNGYFISNDGETFTIHPSCKELTDDALNVKIDNDMIKYVRTSNKCLRINDVTTTDELTNRIDIGNNLGENAMSFNAIGLRDGLTTDINSFMSITINKNVEPGEHYRIICRAKNSKIDTHIFEILMSNDITYMRKKNRISREIINTFSDYNVNLEIHRICVFTNPEEDDNIKNVINSIYHAIKAFTHCPINVISKNDNTINFGSIAKYSSVYKSYQFQRFTSNFINTQGVLESDIDNNEMTFFGNNAVEPIIIDVNNAKNTIYTDYTYAPVHFEALNSRESYIVNFIDISNKLVQFSTSLNISNDMFTNDTLMSDHSTTKKFNIEYISDNGTKFVTKNIETNIIKSIDNPNMYMMYNTNSISPNTATLINIYYPYYFNIGLFGFLSLKDYETAIYNYIPLDSSIESNVFFPVGGDLYVEAPQVGVIPVDDENYDSFVNYIKKESIKIN